MQLNHIPLDDLTPAALNVRKKGGKEISDLLPSLREHGLLQPLLVRPKDDGFEIIAGQRRYHALCALAEEQDAAENVPCLIMAEGDDAQAIEASLTENLARLPMDEIDQYTAFAALVKQGLDTDDIAARFGITTRLVTQRLAIAAIIPPILTAYRKGDIAPQTLRLLTMATKSQQKDWLRLYKSEGDRAPEGYSLKCWLFGGAEIKTQVALFDLADYTGSIVSDLFGEDSYFADSEAFWGLQNSAIAKAKESYLAAGWAEVIVLEVGEYFPSYQYVATCKEDGGKIYVNVAHNGEVSFYEGQLSRKEIEARKRKAEGGAKTSQPELTKAMQNYIGLHKHAAVRQHLLSHQGLALRLAVAQIIAGSPLWCVQGDPQCAAKDSITESLSTNTAEARFTEERADIVKLLGLDLKTDTQTIVPRTEDYGAHRDLQSLFKTLCQLDDDEVMRILTFITVETLPAQSSMVEALGAQMCTDISAVWSPDQTFLDLMRDKQAINGMVAEIAGTEVAAQHITSTAKVQKAVITACLDGTRAAEVKDWTPRYMRFPMGSYKDTAITADTEHKMAAE